MTAGPLGLFPNEPALAAGAAELFVARAAEAARRGAAFTVALSGGSTPAAFYRALASEAYARLVDWSTVHLFWSDERCVPPTHSDSNYGMVQANLLKAVPIPAGQVHRIRGELEPAAAAGEYERVLRAELAGRAGAGRTFDLCFLGLGEDGHTASLFPESAVLHREDSGAWVVAQQVKPLGAWRITLTPAAINAAGTVVFLVSGARKAAILRRVLDAAPDPALPATLIRPAFGAAQWLVDRDAARELTGARRG